MIITRFRSTTLDYSSQEETPNRVCLTFSGVVLHVSSSQPTSYETSDSRADFASITDRCSGPKTGSRISSARL